MAQNRDAPAYQEYASALLANADFRSMTAEAKGICWQMRMECWVNKTVPADPARLARYLGEDRATIEKVLPEVMPFFDSNGDRIRSPELDDYRAHLDGIKDKQSAGGKNSAAKRAENSGGSKTKAGKGFQADSSNLEVTFKSPASNFQVLSTVQTSPIQTSQTQPLKKGTVLVDDPFVSAYQQTESSYEKASNGY